MKTAIVITYFIAASLAHSAFAESTTTSKDELAAQLQSEIKVLEHEVLRLKLEILQKDLQTLKARISKQEPANGMPQNAAQRRPTAQTTRPDELQAARTELRIVAERYKFKYPSHREALRKVELLEAAALHSNKGLTELQIARSDLEVLKLRYRSKHPKYQQAL